MRRQKVYAAALGFMQRLAFSWVALAIGYGVGFGVERIVRALFFFGSETGRTLLWFGIFSLLGWLAFGFPVLVVSPLRREFRNLGMSGMVGGLAGAGLLIGPATVLTGGEILREPRGWELMGIYGSYAFVIGSVARQAMYGSAKSSCGNHCRRRRRSRLDRARPIQSISSRQITDRYWPRPCAI
jgi:hypothetical protein